MKHEHLISAVMILGTTLFIADAMPGADAPATDKAVGDLDQIFDDYWQFRLRRDPERATYLGDHRYDDQIRDYSAKARQDELDFHKSLLVRLRNADRTKLNEADRLSVDLLERTLVDAIDLSRFPEHLMPIKQQDSPQIDLGMIQTTHPFKTPRDCRNYAARLSVFPRQAQQLIALMNEGIAAGVLRPKITILKSIEQLDAMIANNAADSPLYAPARSLDAQAGGEKSRAIIEGAVKVATAGLERLREYLRNTYLPRCRDSVGYCDLPDGKAWYRRLAKHHTTTDRTPEEIHQLGLDELKRIHAEMLEIARQVGFDGDVQAFIEKMRSDPAQHNQSADEIMRRHAEILRRSDANLPKLFGVIPRIPYELKEIEPFRAPQAPEAYYYNAPDDGSRPAYFYVNVFEPKTRPIYTMEALAYHEAQPGHHFQIAIAQEHKDWPAFRRFEHITAFIEGWALYSESLGFELGGYRDPYSRFGRLTFDSWRSARLVVDTGMHCFNWSRERAIDFMKKNTGLSEQNIVSEIDRYIAWPGQALAYKIGELEIRQMRRDAEQTLGVRFDLRAFHDHLLAEGSIPLATLRSRMMSWAQGRKNIPGSTPD